ncbi:inner centromere protein isoform X7 [Prionailurus bengalensis]|uniref:inner centromere protein isoform X7 n=1 Tax=Prionailurus bengalensis TaxID=37029 RepID=UPI001CA95DEF|nr:inner centromere protein isoform X7 [Prionailurus bengalensis]
MGSTAPGPIHLLELCDQKLMEFICNVDNKDLVWLEEIEEEAQRMFTSEFSKEPELMPKTPSQKNRRKKRRVSYIQDENRDPIRKSRLSRRRTRSSQLSSRHLRSKDKVEKLATVVGENGSVLRRVTRAAAAAAAATAALAAPSPTPESPTVLAKELENSLAQGPLLPVVEIGVSERQSAELHLGRLKSARAPSPTPSLVATAPASHSILISDEESTPQKPETGRLASVTVSSLMATPQDPKGRGGGASRSASKLRIAQASPGPQDLAGSPASPWQERVLAPILPDNCSTPTGAHIDPQSVRRSLIAPSSPGRQVSLAQKYSLVAKQEKPVRRSSRRIGKKATEEPAASARIICHSYLERLLNIEVPQKVGPEQKRPSEEAEPAQAAEPEGPKQDRSTLWPRSATKIAISTPGSQPVAGGQETPSKGRQEPKTDQADGPKEPPQSVRRKRSYKQAVSELDEEPQLEDEELQPPRNKTPSPPCPASKVVRPLRTFLHTVQRNQMLMTPTSAPRSSVMKSFIKRNTPLRVDPKCSFVEKERQRLENLRRKEEAEQLRRQKVEEDKRRRLEEVKLKREERLRKVLQARERVEQMKEEKKKQIEQKFAQIDEKTEKVKEERLAEEKAKKKAAAKKMEEVEARRKQEEEARRLRRLQQDEEERRHQELLQKKREEEQERLRRAAEAKRLAEQREQERQLAEQREHERQLAEQREHERRREQERLQAERELQEKEKALRLERELEEKKKKSPACTSYQMTPQGHRPPPKINPDNYGMDLNSDDSTDDEAHPRKPIPTWARGTQLSQAIIHQYHHPPNLLELFGTILPLDLEDIFKKSKPRYHKRTSSAVWNSPPLLGPRVPSSLAYGLKKY